MKFKKTFSARIRASVENSPSLPRTLDCSAIGMSDLHEVCVKIVFLHTSDEKSRSSKYPQKCLLPLIVPLPQECALVLGGFKSFKAPNSPPLAPTLIHLSYAKFCVLRLVYFCTHIVASHASPHGRVALQLPGRAVLQRGKPTL